MRSSKKRSRSSQNRPRSLGNIVNRVFDSSGPEGKVRGTPQQIIEKYQMLARDAQLSNDRVAAENFLQHAEHYTRMLAEAQREMAAEQEARQQQYQQNGGNQTGNGNGNGGQNGNRERGEYRDRNRDDYRDRPDRNERADDRAPSQSDQPQVAEVIDFGGEEAGLVELPEVRPVDPAPTQERRDPRPQSNERRDREPRPPRQPSERNDRNEPRADRGERKEPRAERSEAPRREPRPKPVAVTQPELPAFITGTPDAAAPAEAAEAPAKPKRARAPKKPAADVAGPEAAE